MKRILFGSLAALVLFSCSKENDVTNPSEPGSPATLKIKIVGNHTRAGGSLDTDNSDAAVNNYTMFFFRADGSLDRAPLVVADGATPKEDITVTNSLKEIYVIANANDKEDMSGITDKTSLLAFTVNMDKSNASTQVFPTAPSGTGASVYQKGSDAAITFDASNKATSTVTLEFVPARIKVVISENWSSPNTGNTNNSNGKYVDITDILILNAKSQSFVFNATSQLVASAPFLAGETMDAFTNKPASYTVKTYYAEKVPAAGNAFFYLFENSGEFADPATTFPTIVVLKGKFYDGTTGGKDIYYPARFDNTDIAHAITPGKAYSMEFKLNGDPTSGGGGAVDPSVPILSGLVTVTVTPAEWNTQDVSKEFN